LAPLIGSEITFKRQVTNVIGDQPEEGGTDFFKKDRKDELYILDVEQKSKSFEYGAAYRFVGEKYNEDANQKNITHRGQDLEADQEGLEAWGGRQIGPVRLKGFVSNFYNNVDLNPNRYRMKDFEYGLETSYQLSSMPLYFFGSYSRGSSVSTMEPDGSSKKGSSTETYKGALYFYGGNSFDVTASSSYPAIKEKYQSGETTETYWHEISANIHPVWYISITPTISFSEYKYLEYGESTEIPSASLSMTYSRLFNAVDLSLWGSYSQTKSTDGYQDFSEYSGSLRISWEAGYFNLPKMKFNINLGYDAYLDEVYRNSSSDSYSTSFSFEVPL